MLRAYKTELDPNDKQRTFFKQNAGAARFVFNWALADRKATFAAGGKCNLNEQKRRFNALKNEQFPWLSKTSYPLIDYEFINLDRAYQNFFRRVKAHGEKPGFPKFKSRRRGIGGYTTRGSIYIETSRIRLPKIGWIRLKEHGYLPTEGVRILSVAVSERAGRWFASVQVEEEDPRPAPKGDKVIGVDLGIKALAVCSDGMVFENPKALTQGERKLKRLSRELCRRQKGSRNRDKTKAKISRCHMRIANVRKHALHLVSDYLTAKAKPGTIVIEDLNVSGMMQNHHLAKAIADSSMSELRRQIEYKAGWRGIDLVIADRFYPSSKTCSACGAKKPFLRLDERTFVCEKCGFVIDRDLNAARNLAASVNN